MKTQDDIHKNFNVLVVGAGPAGCSAARAAAEEGATVLILDKKESPGIPVQCGEYIPKLLGREVPIPREIIAQEITGFSFSFGKEQGNLSGPGFIIYRDRFDAFLLQKAIQAGVTTLTKCKALERDDQGIWALHNNDRMKLYGKVIIGTDGPRSRVASWMGNSGMDYSIAIQRTVKAQTSQTATFYFDPQYTSGYGYFFPKGDRAHIGVSAPLTKARYLKELLIKFIQQLTDEGQIDPSIVYDRTGGLLPTGGPWTRTVCDNMILAGDAAAQTNPLTGAGVAQAVICGRAAGKWGARAALKNDMNILKKYDREWGLLFRTPLQRALQSKIAIDSEKDTAAFFGLLKQAWIGGAAP
jgi:geranylgeranyl reductase family protein